MGLRRSVAAVAGLVLAVEAVGVVLLNVFLARVVDDQQMSLGGVEPRSMSASAWGAGAVFGVYLLLCAAVLARTAVRDASPTGLWRILLISAAVVHGLLGAVSVGLVGWGAFAFMMVVLGLLVWSLLAYGVEEAGERAARRDGPSGAGPSGAGPEPAGPPTA